MIGWSGETIACFATRKLPVSGAREEGGLLGIETELLHLAEGSHNMGKGARSGPCPRNMLDQRASNGDQLLAREAPFTDQCGGPRQVQRQGI